VWVCWRGLWAVMAPTVQAREEGSHPSEQMPGKIPSTSGAGQLVKQYSMLPRLPLHRYEERLRSPNRHEGKTLQSPQPTACSPRTLHRCRFVVAFTPGLGALSHSRSGAPPPHLLPSPAAQHAVVARKGVEQARVGGDAGGAAEVGGHKDDGLHQVEQQLLVTRLAARMNPLLVQCCLHSFLLCFSSMVFFLKQATQSNSNQHISASWPAHHERQRAVGAAVTAGEAILEDGKRAAQLRVGHVLDGEGEADEEHPAAHKRACAQARSFQVSAESGVLAAVRGGWNSEECNHNG
jgi:hypothetical protein